MNKRKRNTEKCIPITSKKIQYIRYHLGNYIYFPLKELVIPQYNSCPYCSSKLLFELKTDIVFFVKYILLFFNLKYLTKFLEVLEEKKDRGRIAFLFQIAFGEFCPKYLLVSSHSLHMQYFLFYEQGAGTQKPIALSLSLSLSNTD